MAIDSIANTTSSAGAFSAVAEKDKLGQTEFMRLMIAQLRNQDPTKPADPSEFLGQLAQFGTVSGIQDMQQSLTTLSDALRSTQVLGGTNLVGHEVQAVANAAGLGETGSVSGAVSIPEGTNAAVLIVTDASGQLVRRMPISTQQGVTGFEWDGTTDRGERAPAGNYRFAALADVGGYEEQLETQLTSRVSSVTIDPSTNSLTLNTDIGPIPLSQVRRVM